MPFKLNPPGFLILSTTIGFFCLVALLFFHELPAGTKDILQVLLGGVAGQWTTIIQYHFGSSSGSASKQALLHELTGTGDGASKTEATIKTETVKRVTSEEKEGG